MGKSIIGMMGETGSDFTPESVLGVYQAMAYWVQVVGGSWFGAGYQYGDSTQVAWPGSQEYIDEVELDANRWTYTAPSPGHVWEPYYHDEDLDWEAPYDGTFSNPVFYIPYNERIEPVTLTIYKNNVATTLKIVVDRLETGTVKGTGTLDFVAGDVIVGKMTSAIQDLDDPDYVGETFYVGSFSMTLEVADVVKLPYRSAAHASSYTYEDPDWNGSGGIWPAYPPPERIPSGFEYGVRLNSQQAEQLRVSNVAYPKDPFYQVPDGLLHPLYGAKPMNGIEASVFHGLNTNSDDGWSESEIRRVAQMKVRAPGTFSDLRFFVFTGVGTTESFLLESAQVGDGFVIGLVDGLIEVDGSPTLTREIGFEESGTLSFVGTQAVADGELINFAARVQDANATSDAEADIWHFRAEFESNDEWFDIHAHGLDSTGMSYAQYTSRALTISAERYFAVFGGTDQQTIRSGLYLGTANRGYHEMTIAEGMEFKNLRCQVGVLSGGTVRVGLMADGVKLTNLVDITTTGWQEDTTHTDTVNAVGIGATANICYYVEVLTGTPVIRFDSFTITASVVAQTGETICNNDCPDAIEFQELKERTLRMLGEDPDNPVYWTSDEIGRLVNDAYTVACRDSKMVQHIEQVTLVEDQAEYTLTDRTGQIFRVTYDDRVIQNITKWEHDRTLPDWEAEVGYIDSYMTTLQDSRKIRTYKAWDGTGATSYWPFGGTIGGTTAGAATYTAWNNAATYNDGDLVSHLGSYYELIEGSGPIEPTDSEVFYEPGVAEFWEDVWLLLDAEPAPQADVHTAYLNVWSVKNPILMSEPCDEPELPQWSHLGLCFAAAAKALRKYGEARNDNLASVYEAMAIGYFKALKSHAANRTPERLIAMGRGIKRGLRKPMPYDQEIVD